MSVMLKPFDWMNVFLRTQFHSKNSSVYSCAAVQNQVGEIEAPTHGLLHMVCSEE